MTDDLDPAAVERLSAEWFARAQSWGAMAGDGSATGALEREKAAVRRDMAMTFSADLDALTAARAGEPDAPAPSAKDREALADRAAFERFPVQPGYVRDRFVEDVHRAQREGFRLGWLAARQPAAPTVSAEQVDEACSPHQDPNGPDLRVPVVAALRTLGIEVTP